MKKFITLLTLFTLLTGNIIAQEKPYEGIKPALLVIDIQNKFLPMVDEREKEIAFYFINAYIAGFRSAGLPIIRIYHSDAAEGPFPGTPEFEFPAEIVITPDDPQIIKTYPNSFNNTDLEKILKEKGVNTLFLCGLSSVGCVLATYMGAHDHDFKVFMLKDAIMSHNSDYTDQIENIFSAINYDAVEVMLMNVK